MKINDDFAKLEIGVLATTFAPPATGKARDLRLEEVCKYINDAPTPEERQRRKSECFGYLYSSGGFFAERQNKKWRRIS